MMSVDAVASGDLLTSEIAIEMMRALMPYAASMEVDAVIEAAIVVLASVVVHTVIPGSDEDVHRLMLSLQRELYREILRARQNVLAIDADA